ncbi:L,D-transpeptidase family protein [Motiliproteus sp.]|uniref:L,D-transpeptidase family protein n=1 Tax=Motiliproteus sp. TaxID=1898955 RepID=UPI003BAB4ADC
MCRRYTLALCLILLSAVARGEVRTVLPNPDVMPPTSRTAEAQIPIAAAADPRSFGSLIEAAEFYSDLPQRGWQPLANGALLRQGDSSPRVEALRQMLSLYGDYQLPGDRRVLLAYFDSELEAALIRFQHRHGLKPDGILGPDSLQAMNVEPTQRAYQLLVNHERQLALQRIAPPRYVQVNVPGFQLRVFDHQQAVMEMKAIVGRISRQTPTLQSEIRSLVLNPAWNVPKSIAYKDILPKWRDDRDYLDRHNMKIVSGWGQQKIWVDQQQADPEQLYRGREYLRLYQLPGANNALGQIKFDFPNPYAVYLHDTPSKSLFSSHQRAFSSGCVRLEDPQRLASYLLGMQRLEKPLHQMLAETDTRRIRLSRPVGLYLTYWTAWLDPQQRLQLREDIYQQDPSKPRLEAADEIAMLH